MNLVEYINSKASSGGMCKCTSCRSAWLSAHKRKLAFQTSTHKIHYPSQNTDHSVEICHSVVYITDKPAPEELLALIKAHTSQIRCDPLDGLPHSERELAAWLADCPLDTPHTGKLSDLATKFMGLGCLYRLWQIMTIPGYRGKNASPDVIKTALPKSDAFIQVL